MICAYCGKDRPATNEHIWPRCIIERAPTYVARYSERANRFFAGDLEVGDVCKECNGGILSDLDAYGCKLYDQYFAQFAAGDTVVTFDCDFVRLARWLLKLSYNSARTGGTDAATLAAYVPFILGGASDASDLSICVDLVLPSVTRSQDGGPERSMFPQSTRLCRVEFTDPVVDWVTVRLVAINSYYFTLVITPPTLNRDVPKAELLRVARSIRGERLYPGQAPLELRPSGSEMFEMHRDFATMRGPQFDEYVSRQRKRKQ